MSDYKIEKKVPVPTTASRNNYPFGEMEVGDSFSIPIGEEYVARASAYWYSRTRPVKFSIRRTKEGYRCWRVA